MFEKILQFFAIRCRHRHLSQPFAVAGRTASVGDWESVASPRSLATQTRTGHYVVCLDCGQKFPYDWSQMRIVR